MPDTNLLKRVTTALMETLSPSAMPDAFVPLAVAIMRQLATGRPVTRGDLGALAGGAADPAVIATTLAESGMADFDGDGNIVGMIVTSTRTRHRFETGGVEIYTWCAVDTLFMPAVLCQPARVESSCPVTGQRIRLDVDPERIRSVAPQGAYVSYVAPGVTAGVAASCGKAGLTGADGAFCSNASFFASREAAEAWLADHPGAVVMPVREGFDVAAKIWSEPFRAAMDRAAGEPLSSSRSSSTTQG